MSTVTLTNITPGRADVAVNGKIVGHVVRVTEDYYSEEWGWSSPQPGTAHGRRWFDVKSC